MQPPAARTRTRMKKQETMMSGMKKMTLFMLFSSFFCVPCVQCFQLSQLPIHQRSESAMLVRPLMKLSIARSRIHSTRMRSETAGELNEGSQNSKRDKTIKSLGTVVIAASVGVAALRPASLELPFQQTLFETAMGRSFQQRLAFVEEDDAGSRDVRTIQLSENKEPEIKVSADGKDQRAPDCRRAADVHGEMLRSCILGDCCWPSLLAVLGLPPLFARARRSGRENESLGAVWILFAKVGGRQALSDTAIY
eukprot:768015-Hanusia_phi.AAC.1